MITLTGITWITTYNCNLACQHCFFDTRSHSKYMDPGLADMVLNGFEFGRHMFWQHLSGGEIFLDESRLLDIIGRIHYYFKKDIGISTNAFWAANYDKAMPLVQKLAALGVTGIALSADYYHQQQMPIDGPQNLVKILCSGQLKTHSYIMGARLHTSVQNSALVNAKSEEITKLADQGFGLPVARAMERSIGKGCHINVPKKKGIPRGHCTELNTCLGQRSPFNPAMVWIDPYGNVMVCYGIIIGNVYQQPFNEIIGHYNAAGHPVLKLLAEEGPAALYEMAVSNGTDMPESYFDECDLCYQSRAALRKLYPQLFGPHECYPV
ncbi:MAG: hypothetical protein JXB34_11080 [Bacteroidales bacterium]|nr:hypothetical protein [Bacteroidales bacterium]